MKRTSAWRYSGTDPLSVPAAEGNMRSDRLPGSRQNNTDPCSGSPFVRGGSFEMSQVQSERGTAKDDDTELAFMPAHTLARRMREGALHAADVIDCYLRRIARHDPKLHAYIAVYADEARAGAEIADLALSKDRCLGP